MESSLLLFRPAKPEDQAFLYNSWLKAYRNSKITREWPNDVYYPAQTEAITKILFTAGTILACSAEDPNQIFGYIVSQKIEGTQVVHFLYVKHLYRRLGIAKALLKRAFGEKYNEQETYTTHWLPRCKFFGWKRYQIVEAGGGSKPASTG